MQEPPLCWFALQAVVCLGIVAFLLDNADTLDLHIAFIFSSLPLSIKRIRNRKKCGISCMGFESASHSYCGCKCDFELEIISLMSD